MLSFQQAFPPETRSFIGLTEALTALRPSSRAGKRLLLAPDVFGPGEEDALAAHHARLASARAWFEGDEAKTARVERHLRELPGLSDVFERECGVAEVALWAAFRHHHQALAREMADSPLAPWLALARAEALDDGALGNDGEARFYLEDARSPELSALRAELRALKRRSDEMENEARRALALRHGLSSALDEWVVDREDVARVAHLDADAALVRVGEGVASLRYARRPTEADTALRAELAAALRAERALEQTMYAEIARVIAPRAALWRAEEAKLAALDWLLAAVRLWRDWNGVLPEISRGRENTAPEFLVREGRHVVVAERLKESGRAYEPLTLAWPESRAILCGANMGGKTVVLRTLGLLQALAQLGLPVPASELKTGLYQAVLAAYPAEQLVGGLSSFGAEVAQLAAIMPRRQAGCLYLIDEPGRATRLAEGRALTRALIEALGESPSRLMLATHLDHLDEPGVARLLMHGLRREALAAWRAGGVAPILHELMDYRVSRREEAGAARGEALDVAELLGLEPALIARARRALPKE